MGDKIAAIVGTLAIATLVTAMVLPGRQTPALVSAIGGAYSNAALASEGQSATGAIPK
jgi:hypothetical protein